MRKQLAIALATAALLTGGIGLANAATQHAAKQKTMAVHHTMAKAKAVSASKLSKRQVKQVQMSLNKMGFDAGHADGRYGSHTRKAVKNFHAARHIQGKGLNAQMLSALGVQTRGTAQATRTAATPNKTVKQAKRPVRETTGSGATSAKPATTSAKPMQPNKQQ